MDLQGVGDELRAVAVVGSARDGALVCIDGLPVKVGLVSLPEPAFNAHEAAFADLVVEFS